MRKYVLVFMVCLVAVGCASTKVFMGSYDSVKITVSGNQAQMTAENLPYETQSSGEKLERKISEGPICVDTTESDSCKTGNTQGKLQVTIVCSDENLIRELPNNFSESGFPVEKRLRKPSNKSTIISKVTIYPKRKVITDTKEEYHLIEFETMGGLSGGIHRVLIKDPLVFMFPPENILEIKMFITHSEYSKFMAEDITIPTNVNFQILSNIISTMKKPIKIIFTISQLTI